MKRHLPIFTLVLLLLGACVPAQAQEVNPADAMMKRMRETLRNTMIQLQTAQAEVAALQAKQTESEARIAELEAKLKAQTKQADADKAAAARTATELNAKIATQTQENLALNQTLDKWKNGYKQAAEFANSTEAKRSQLANRVILLDREVADQRVKNRELYKLGNEILTRYRNFGLGNALLAREPFTGIARVKLETLLQDYGDKLQDQKIKPEPAAKPAAKSETAPPAAATATQAPAKKKS